MANSYTILPYEQFKKLNPELQKLISDFSIELNIKSDIEEIIDDDEDNIIKYYLMNFLTTAQNKEELPEELIHLKNMDKIENKILELENYINSKSFILK